ncbi:hypothetical protein KXD40_006665 [Peronospora effusa]|nr:hypothetical protein KXD40_006665 [Peronospora effusa]
MADCHQVRGNDSKIDGTAEDKKDVQCDAEDTTSGYDDFCLLTSSIIKLDPKDVLIIKDGTVRVADMHEHGYQHAAHSGKTGYTSTATLARTSSLPSMPLHSLPLDHNHTPYVSTALPVSIAMVSSEFSQMSTSMTSPSAVIENGIYLSPWETNGAENKPTVPDFDESMDFLMDVYSANPSEINTVMPSQSIGMTVTPTACIPRAPPTPMSSLVMKRHPGYGLIQQERRHAKLDTREQEVKAYDST